MPQMTAVQPSLLDGTPSLQEVLDEGLLVDGSGDLGALGAPTPGTAALTAGSQESPAELADDTYVDFTAAAQNWFDTERMNGVPDSIISVQSMLSLLVGSMSANATEAFATAAQQLDRAGALALTQA